MSTWLMDHLEWKITKRKKTNVKPLCLGIKELLEETGELVSPVLAQFSPLRRRHEQHSRQIRCRNTNKVMDLLKQLALCTFLLSSTDIWAALIPVGHVAPNNFPRAWKNSQSEEERGEWSGCFFSSAADLQAWNGSLACHPFSCLAFFFL